MTTTIRNSNTLNTTTAAATNDTQHDFLSDLHHAEIRTAGVLDNWRMRIATYADAKFSAGQQHYQYAKDTARQLMVKFRLRWRSQADAHVGMTEAEKELMADTAVAMQTVIIAVSDAINAVQNNSILSAHAQRTLYTMGRVMDAAGVPNNLRALR